ncbi:hypothetical protein HY213_04610 [Candidatus Peregrinibacteria bacterium]|nr:hypothetical protein [Candidatus Peregrinibacteria bacterium]
MLTEVEYEQAEAEVIAKKRTLQQSILTARLDPCIADRAEDVVQRAETVLGYYNHRYPGDTIPYLDDAQREVDELLSPSPTHVLE